MKQYKNLITEILLEGEHTKDRTGVGTKSIFGTRMEFNLRKSFPAVTTKKLFWKGVVAELLWFLSGSTNVNELSNIQYGDPTRSNIWTANYENQGKALGYINGELGPVYGAQFHHHNQLNDFIEGIRSNPHSRRHIISLWNPEEIEDMSLPPCHGLTIQAHVNSKNELSIQWYQRSVDVFLGLPYNIASYALFTHMIAQICGLEVGTLIFCGGDTHIYMNHMSQCEELLSRSPMNAPQVEIPWFASLEELIHQPVDNFKLLNYRHSGAILAPMAV